MHAFDGQLRLLFRACGFSVEIRALGDAGVGEDEVDAAVRGEDGREDGGERRLGRHVAGVEGGGGGGAGRVEVEDVDGPVGEVGEGGCDGEAHAGCWGVVSWCCCGLRFGVKEEAEMGCAIEVCSSIWA